MPSLVSYNYQTKLLYTRRKIRSFGSLLQHGCKCYPLWRNGSTLTASPSSFILLRYSGIVATLPSLWFTSAPTQHCQLAAILSQFGVVLAVASSGALFCFRVFAIWSDNKPIKGFIGIMYFFMIGAYVSWSPLAPLFWMISQCRDLIGFCSYPIPCHPRSSQSSWFELPTPTNQVMGCYFLCVLSGFRQCRADRHTCKASEQ